MARVLDLLDLLGGPCAVAEASDGKGMSETRLGNDGFIFGFLHEALRLFFCGIAVARVEQLEEVLGVSRVAAGFGG
jgi:hypothetical protein